MEYKVYNDYYSNKSCYEGTIRRGDIFFFDKGTSVGTEQMGGRPGVIVSNNTGNVHSDNVLVVYTTTQPKSNLPTHVTIESTGRTSTVLCEQIHTLSTKKISKYYGSVTDEEMKAIDKALVTSIGVSDDSLYEMLGLNKDNDEVAEPFYLDENKQTNTKDVEIAKLIAERDTYKAMYQELLKAAVK